MAIASAAATAAVCSSAAEISPTTEAAAAAASNLRRGRPRWAPATGSEPASVAAAVAAVEVNVGVIGASVATAVIAAEISAAAVMVGGGASRGRFFDGTPAPATPAAGGKVGVSGDRAREISCLGSDAWVVVVVLLVLVVAVVRKLHDQSGGEQNKI